MFILTQRNHCAAAGQATMLDTETEIISRTNFRPLRVTTTQQISICSFALRRDVAISLSPEIHDGSSKSRHRMGLNWIYSQVAFDVNVAGVRRSEKLLDAPLHRAMSSTHCRCRYKKLNLYKKRNLYGWRDKSQDGTSARTSVPDELDTKQLQKHVLPLHCSSVFYSPMSLVLVFWSIP